MKVFVILCSTVLYVNATIGFSSLLYYSLKKSYVIYNLCDTDSYITWQYQIADHNCRITWVYNKYKYLHARRAVVFFISNIFMHVCICTLHKLNMNFITLTLCFKYLSSIWPNTNFNVPNILLLGFFWL